MIGEVIGGRYKVTRLLGSGGMGAVYEARHKTTSRRVALKVITDSDSDPELLARFKVEARAAGVIESEHIARVLDMDEDAERKLPFLAMELLDGEDLQQLIERLGALHPDVVTRIALQACRGLRNAHKSKVLHRDIKPANIFLCKREDGTRVVKLLDFGIAKLRGERDLFGQSGTGGKGITTTGTLMGSPLYMSPEQTNGLKKVDHRSDIWSLGVVMFEALAGHTPFHKAEGIGDLIVKLCTRQVPVREHAPNTPAELAAIVDRMLSIDIAARYQSVEEVLADLKALVPDRGVIDEAQLVRLDNAPSDAPSAPITSQPHGTETAETDTALAQTDRAVTTSSLRMDEGPKMGLWIALGVGAAVALAVFIGGSDDVAPASPEQDVEPSPPLSQPAAAATGAAKQPAAEAIDSATAAPAASISASARASASTHPRRPPSYVRPPATPKPKAKPIDPLDEM